MKIKRLLCGYGLALVLAGQTSCTSTKQGDADTRQLAKLRAQAEQGRAKAQNELGEAFGLGKLCLATNSVEAVKWYHKAAEQNDAKAQCNLADCYYEGRGGLHDLVEAVKWYRKAADQNDAKAQWALGRCYALGHGVVKDDVEAADLDAHLPAVERAALQ
jgi:TPR repeat protein